MASRVIRTSRRLQSTIATPMVTSEPATLPRRGKAIAPGRPPTPSGRPAGFLSIEIPKLPSFVEPAYNPILIPPVLKFSFEQAKKHLIEADGRFEIMFAEFKCKRFGEWKNPIDPYRTLVKSMFAHRKPVPVPKSVKDRFLLLFDRSLPEDREQGFYSALPSPARLASVDENILRTTGLSQQKATYLLDIANRFADGRWSAQKFADASDEELVEMLADVRGFEKLTGGMFAIHSLRRPDILPVRDLRTQKGLLNWVISSHEPDRYPLRMKPKEFLGASEGGPNKSEPGEDTPLLVPRKAPTSTTNVSSSSSKQPNGVLLIPKAPVQLPEGMTLEMLKARAHGKKVNGRYYLLPDEMEALTASWKPYRSLGAVYMWALMDGLK